jgi:hypothetical protein
MLRRTMTRRSTIFLAFAAFLVIVLVLGAPAAPDLAGRDPLAREIDRWATFLRETKSADENWAQVRQATEPVIAKAREALRDRRRLLALQRLAAARMYPAGFSWILSIPAEQRKTIGQLDDEWGRTGRFLKTELGGVSPGSFSGIHPAAVRAIAEATIPQVRAYYDASLEYGKNTRPDDGYLYLGAARAQRDLIDLCRRLSTSSALRPPPLRSVASELDALEGDLLAAYRPPAAIDKHSDFIAASAVLKEARELDAAALRYGAMLRYLVAAQRAALLRPSPPALTPAELAAKMGAFHDRLRTGGVDHTIGRLFLETAEADVQRPDPEKPPVASAIVGDVLPRYFAALEPLRSEPAKPAPRATVTLVRWPYT